MTNNGNDVTTNKGNLIKFIPLSLTHIARFSKLNMHSKTSRKCLWGMHFL